MLPAVCIAALALSRSGLAPALQVRPVVMTPALKVRPVVMRSYVPDGLTAEQYEALTAKERSRELQKDYAAWGPRFKRVAAPFWATRSFLAKSGAQISVKPTQQKKSVLAAIATICRMPAIIRAGLVGLLAILAIAVNAVVVRRSSSHAVACTVALL
jgi:hypothetical protein